MDPHKRKEIDHSRREVIQWMEERGDPERVKRSATYFSTSMKVAGITNPGIRKMIGGLRAGHAGWESADWIFFCKSLVSERLFEAQILAFEILAGNRKLLDSVGRDDLEDLAKNLDNWASVDHFATGIYGVLWRKGVVTDKEILQLTGSEDPWKRRLAVVATVALNQKSKGGTGDTARTLRVCEQVAGDPHPMVRKALSWALRELSKRDPSSVSAFLEEHSDRLPSRVLREVNHKLHFGTKN